MTDDEEMRPEYDFSNGVRGKYAERYDPTKNTINGKPQMMKEIIIDEYFPNEPTVLWYCNNCGRGSPVTAQFDISEEGEEAKRHLTVCVTCLLSAVEGIVKSYSEPKELNDEQEEEKPIPSGDNGG